MPPPVLNRVPPPTAPEHASIHPGTPAGSTIDRFQAALDRFGHGRAIEEPAGAPGLPAIRWTGLKPRRRARRGPTWPGRFAHVRFSSSSSSCSFLPPWSCDMHAHHAPPHRSNRSTRVWGRPADFPCCLWSNQSIPDFSPKPNPTRHTQVDRSRRRRRRPIIAPRAPPSGASAGASPLDKAPSTPPPAHLPQRPPLFSVKHHTTHPCRPPVTVAAVGQQAARPPPPRPTPAVSDPLPASCRCMCVRPRNESYLTDH